MPDLSNKLELPRCPHCSVAKPGLSRLQAYETKDHYGKNQRSWCSYLCSNCGGIVFAAAMKGSTDVIEMYPEAEIFADTAIPEKAQSYLNQSIESIHAPSGAVMLAASSVDAMLKAKGYTGGSLYSRIDKAVTDHLITSDMAKWAHNIRLDANDERHADEDAPMPDTADAGRCVSFAKALVQFLFILPSRVERGIAEAEEATPPATP